MGGSLVIQRPNGRKKVIGKGQFLNRTDLVEENDNMSRDSLQNNLAQELGEALHVPELPMFDPPLLFVRSKFQFAANLLDQPIVPILARANSVADLAQINKHISHVPFSQPISSAFNES
jgi:hypothetical protein